MHYTIYKTTNLLNGVESTKIKKDVPIPEGWKKGRKKIYSHLAQW